jgi:A/G-specific adenine glycosylase
MSVRLPDGPVHPDARAVATTRRRLRAWYRRHRRDMPWRRTRDPWPIWVSEVMLQQTQVATATPFYQRFLERFPTLESLARAPLADVLTQWAGLGYYRRARYLHEAARTVVRDHAGRIPADSEAFRRLPGVGRYTTAAVLSISFGTPLAVLDGNVARVLSRRFAVAAAVRDSRGAKTLWALAQTLVPARDPGDWNQAMMELGATVCLPRAPRCDECPLADECAARARGLVEQLPPVPKRRAVERIARAVARIERGGRLLVVRRDGPLLAGLWEPPGVDAGNGGSPARALASALRGLGVHATLERTGTTIEHTITHRAIAAEVWQGTVRGPIPRRADLRWVDPRKPAVALTALAKKVATVRARTGGSHP